MSKIKSITERPAQEWANQFVLVRVDFNVPIVEGKITSDNRILAAIPTLEYLLDRGAKVILASHLGRPKKGERKESLRLKPVGQRLEELIKRPVLCLEDCIGKEVKQTIESSSQELFLLENVRFYSEEEANDLDFAQSLASLANIYVNDAFGAAHRAHASTAGVANYLPSYAGLLMMKEVESLNQILYHPQTPFTAIIGGAKISTKLGVLESLLPKVDKLIIGGAMAFTFLASQGFDTGSSLVETDYFETAQKLLKTHKDRLVLPQDIVLGKGLDASEASKTVSVEEGVAFDGLMGLDIGPKSIKELTEILENSRTILWNGPLGVFENPAFAEGTTVIGQVAAKQTAKGCITVVGGGDSVAAVEQLGLEEQFTHISTGGGASLEYIEGKELPGLLALKQGAK